MQALQSAEASSQQATVRVQQLITLAEISTEFFGTCDMNFMPNFGNAAAMRMVGLTDLEQVKRTPLQEFFFPEDLAFITEEFFPRVLREGQGKVEIRFRHFVTGEPVWVDYSLVVLKDEMGRATGLGTVTHDLTKRKRNELALKVSEARFRALATVGSSSVYRMSPDWREMRQLDGADFLPDTDEATTDWVDTYIPTDERPRVREAINRAIADKGVFELEHRVLRVDGTVGWTCSRAIPLFDDVGNIKEWFGAATDVTARVKKDQSFTRLFQASPAPFLVLKPDAPHFTILEVNDAYLSATMRTRDDVVGRGIFEAYPDNPDEPVAGGVSTLRASLEHVLTSRQPDILPNLQYDVVRPDGSFEKRWWSPVNSAVLDGDGKVEALIHNANDVTEARKAELALRESEEQYRTLFETMGQGYALVELVRDESGNVVDQRYLAFNPAIERLLGTTAADAAGKLASEIFPAMEPSWTAAFDRVVREGRPERIEQFFRPLGRWFEVYAYPAGGDRFVTLYEDTTERKRVEIALNDSEERQAFLLKLSDTLRPLADPLKVQVEAMRVLGQHIGVNRAQYHEIQHDDEWLVAGGGYANGVELHTSYGRMEEYGAFVKDAYRAGRTLVSEDLEADPRISTAERAAFASIGVRSFVAVPLVKNGHFAAVLGLDNHAVRSWSPAEITLVEEVAERTWAAVERARAEAALHDSEERFRQFSDASTDVLWIRNAITMRMEFASPAFDAIYEMAGPDRGGDDRLRSWARLIVPEHRKRVLANFRRVRGGERVEQEFQVKRASDGNLRWIHNTDFPLHNAAGSVIWIAGLGADITEARAFADRQEVLVAELQHRTRNLIAVVGSLAERTVERATSLEDFDKRFGVRLSALSRVQGLLSHLTIGDRVTFDELLNTELAAHGAPNGLSKQLTLSGPINVPLRSGTVQTFALALHELATNAVKYGALAAPNGHLAVTWRVEPSVDNQPPILHLEWRETGVSIPPHDLATARRGYGRELIERALPYQLGASTTYELRADGVCCTIAVPISHGAATGSEEE